MKVAESTQIRIDVSVKTELEALRDNVYRCKTHSDAIHQLIYDLDNFKKFQCNVKKEKADRDDVDRNTGLFIEPEVKNEFLTLQKNLKLNDTNMIRFLLHHYGAALHMDMVTFDFYRELIN
ncbi:hypothetical protein D3C74_186220 [compost metagenome]